MLNSLVGKTQYAVARPNQKRFSLSVLLTLGGMHTAIKFDREATIWAAEINHERANGMLAAKLQTRKAAIAERLPEQLF